MTNPKSATAFPLQWHCWAPQRLRQIQILSW